MGHGTLDADAFTDLLQQAGIEGLWDVRRYPGSRRHPHFASAEMSHWLPDAGVAYRHVGALGGRRKPDPDSPHVGLRNDQFRAYADHMATSGFTDPLKALVDEARERRVAIMCAESLWWRCHRRLVADHLVLVERVEVEHLFHDGRMNRHSPTPEARAVDGAVIYDVGTQGSLLDDG
ncbi:DUF488 domain-containing protein [soil metagenome]